jgi:hypothetical protein
MDPIVLGIIALAAVWLWSSAQVNTAAINANLLTPNGLNALGNTVGSTTNGIASLIAAIGGPTGSNSGGGPNGGQSSGSGNPSVFTPSFDPSNLTGTPSLTLPGGPDGGDTASTSFGTGFTSSDLGIGSLSSDGS